MINNKITFALYYGNRGFFPGSLFVGARKELKEAVKNAGFEYLEMDESLTRYGAVETIQEGKKYSDFLKDNYDKIDGVIVCLPNFGDENGAYHALKNFNKPILMQAYPDEFGKLGHDHRRDSVCGKLAMCNVFRQSGIKYTLTKNFACHPLSEDFKEDLIQFAGICRGYNGLKSINIGAIGARTTAFKTVRIDEIAMQKKRVNIETIDLSLVFDMMDKVSKDKVESTKEYYKNKYDFSKYKDEPIENMARLNVVLEELIKKYDLSALSLRCWDEIELKYHFAPCVVVAEFNERGIPISCELDVDNALMMKALTLVSDSPVILLDANNNFKDDLSKCILFHCGPAPLSFIEGKAKVDDHLTFKKSYGDFASCGVHVGKLITGDVTIGSIKTEDGSICSFALEGEFTKDEIDSNFFGVGAVFKGTYTKANDMFNFMALNGYRHHVTVCKGHYLKAIKELFENYLEYNFKAL